jgi:hypothetical protein
VHVYEYRTKKVRGKPPGKKSGQGACIFALFFGPERVGKSA